MYLSKWRNNESRDDTMGCEEPYWDMSSAENRSLRDSLVIQLPTLPAEKSRIREDSKPSPLKSLAKLPPTSLGAGVSPQYFGSGTVFQKSACRYHICTKLNRGNPASNIEY